MVYVLLFFAAMTVIGLLMKLFSKDNSKSKKSRVSTPKPPQPKPEQKQPVKEQGIKPKKKVKPVPPIPAPHQSESKPQVTKSENKTSSFVTLPSSYASSKNFSNLNLSDAEFQKEIVAISKSMGKFHAISFAMQVKGWGLKQAKTYCDQLSVTPPPKKQKNTPPDPVILSETKEKMRVAGKLEALKFLSLQTGLNFQESKKYCDQLEEELRDLANSSKPIPTPTPKNAASSDPQTETIDLESEIEKLMAITKWDYATSKAYCEQALEYKKKIGAPAQLKKK
jgi:ribosomal protein L7/L12